MAKITLSQLNQRLKEARLKATEKGSRREFGVGEGLRVRVSPSGTASFAYRYRSPGLNQLKSIKLRSIGRTITRADLEAAQSAFREYKAQRDQGIDPLVSRDKARAEAARTESEIKAQKADNAYTVERLVNEYLDVVCERKRSWREDKRILEKYIVPYLDKPATLVTHRDVRRVLGYLKDSPVMRDRTLACARSVWNWSTELTDNPWSAEKIPTRQPRTRVLSKTELQVLVHRCASDSSPGSSGVALLLHSGCRRDEVTSARREEFDLQHSVWRIPEERMKSGQDHSVYLSEFSGGLVSRILNSHNSEWLFPSTRTPGPLAKEHAYKWLKSEVGYTLHDLRRTFATWMGEALSADGMPVYDDAVIDRVLAHKKRGVNRHYNFARLNGPARRAWSDWSSYLNSLATAEDPRGVR